MLRRDRRGAAERRLSQHCRRQHRRDALWQVEEAARAIGPLLRGNRREQDEIRKKTPLRKMNDEERLAADFAGTGITTGPHLMAYHRADADYDYGKCFIRQPERAN